jgi:hypothetical protein
MKAQTLIDNYRNTHAGKSAFIDSQMNITEQAMKDAERNRNRGDKEFTIISLYLARNTMTCLLDALPAPDAFRRIIIDIYSAIDNIICDIQESR